MILTGCRNRDRGVYGIDYNTEAGDFGTCWDKFLALTDRPSSYKSSCSLVNVLPIFDREIHKNQFQIMCPSWLIMKRMCLTISERWTSHVCTRTAEKNQENSLPNIGQVNPDPQDQ